MKTKILLCCIVFLGIILRFFQLGTNPPSLYWDEASLGYNAYSIATSGRDEHGEFLPIDRFIAFGDYKPPGYIYAAAASIGLFGTSEWAVRFPSAIAGSIMVLLTYLLVSEWKKGTSWWALLSAFLVAISPWSIQLSRVAFEANLAACFNLAGIYLFILSKRKRWTLLLSFIFFALSFYTFNANRIIAPLILLALCIVYSKDVWSNKRWLAISVVCSLILIVPSVPFLQDRESKLRFQEVTIFTSLETVKTANSRTQTDENTRLGKLFHNRRVLFTLEFFSHYFDNFKGRFLFTHGDKNPRLAVQGIGQLYPWELPFIILGFIWLWKKEKRVGTLILLWILITPIPAGTARETPHALRIISILPMYQILAAFGAIRICMKLKTRFSFIHNTVLFVMFAFLITCSLYYYLHTYYVHYPRKWSGEWQYGYKEMVSYVGRVQDNYDTVYVTKAMGRPYIYFAFYMRYPNGEFLRDRKATRDWFGFWEVNSLGKIVFDEKEAINARGRILLVTTPGNLPGGFTPVQRIVNLSGEEVFIIGERL